MKSSSDDRLECAICGLRSNNLNSHISRVHKMKPFDYKITYDRETCQLTLEQIEKMRQTKLSRDTKHKQSRREAQFRADETIANGVTPLRCHLCDFSSATSLISHVTRTHGMKLSDYRETYPNDIMQRASPSQRKKNSRVMKMKLEDHSERKKFMEWRSFPSEVKHWTRKGFSIAIAHEKVVEFQRIQSLKGNNDSTRMKRREKSLGDKNPMSLQSISKREGVTLADASKMTPCFGRLGFKHPMFGKKHSEEAIKKIGQHINHLGRSKIEHELTDELVDKYGGEKNAHACGWCCDYVNHDNMIIVEFFGDFWHHNPRLYDANFVNKLTKRSSTQVWDRDARKVKELINMGYQVIIVWETDWKQNRDECLKGIKNAFNRIL